MPLIVDTTMRNSILSVNLRNLREAFDFRRIATSAFDVTAA
jgi:hypothetical protein